MTNRRHTLGTVHLHEFLVHRGGDDRVHNGAQPIDQFVFRDADGSHYIVYGGCGTATSRS